MKVALQSAFAFFDVDETILVEKSMFTILEAIGHAAPGFNVRGHRAAIAEMRAAGYDRAEVNRFFYRGLKGLGAAFVAETAARYFKRRTAESEHPLFVWPVVMRLRDLAARGIEPVFVSGSATIFLRPVAAMLEVQHVLATTLEEDASGCLTGEITGRCMIGSGKAEAVRDFLSARNVDPAVCWGFGDHPSDADFLSLLGQSHIVAGNPDAEAIAAQNGWLVVSNFSENLAEA